MSLFVDTTVWSLALRRDSDSDSDPPCPEVELLRQAIETGVALFTTGLVLQELLQGFAGPQARDKIIARFSALPFVRPERTDHVEAAEVRNACRARGIQVGTIDALYAQLCIRHELIMLTTDNDFSLIATVRPLSVWSP